MEALGADSVVVDFERIIGEGLGFSVEALNVKFGADFCILTVQVKRGIELRIRSDNGTRRMM